MSQPGVKLTASSEKEPRVTTVSIETQPNSPLPDKASMKEVTRTFSYAAANAADASNGTRWVAAESDTNPTLTADLGKATQINEIQLCLNHPTEGHKWVLEKSTNGKKWTVCGSQNESAPRPPYITDNIVEARNFSWSIEEDSRGLVQEKPY